MAMINKPVSAKIVVENCIDSFNKELEAQREASIKEDKAYERSLKESEGIYNLGKKANYSFSRYTSFGESVTAALLSESIYTVFAKAMDESLMQKPGTTGIMRAMISDFIKEDCYEIMSKMRTGSVALSEMYNLIGKTKKKILESVDKDNPDTLTISKDDKDEFFKSLNYTDTDSISSAIKERVADSVMDFMQRNAEDHEEIIEKLNLTKQKIDNSIDATETVKESYNQLAKRVIGKIRSRDRGVFDSMVNAMCESVMKNKDLHDEFMEGAKLNLPKIIDRIQIMYTFMETVNTMRLANVDENYIHETVESLRS